LPKGYYKKCLLTKIPLPQKYRDNKAGFYKKIEKEIFNRVKVLGGIGIHIPNRKAKNGETEWIFAREDKILQAFDEAHDKYHGNLDYWELEKPLKKKLKKLQDDSIFQGKIYFDD
jgi:hypothetical protein